MRAWLIFSIQASSQRLLPSFLSYSLCWSNNLGIRALLPKLFDQHKLYDRKLGNRRCDDAWIEKMSQALMKPPADQAAGLVAEAVVEGWSADSIHEAISLVA